MPAADTGAEAELIAQGFGVLDTTQSKGHAFEIWVRAPANATRTAWKVAVVSRGTTAFATGYVTDGVLRASVPIADPQGHLLFRADMRAGKPVAGGGFQSKFGAL